MSTPRWHRSCAKPGGQRWLWDLRSSVMDDNPSETGAPLPRLQRAWRREERGKPYFKRDAPRHGKGTDIACVGVWLCRCAAMRPSGHPTRQERVTETLAYGLAVLDNHSSDRQVSRAVSDSWWLVRSTLVEFSFVMFTDLAPDKLVLYLYFARTGLLPTHFTRKCSEQACI